MNDSQPRRLQLPLDFLDPEQQCTAHLYRDDPAVPTRTRVRIDRLTVDSQHTLALELAPRGGQALRLVPK